MAIAEGERGESAPGGVAVLDVHDEQRRVHAIARGQLFQIGGCGHLPLGVHGGSGCFTSAFGCSLKT